jgi:hypothetical protein
MRAPGDRTTARGHPAHDGHVRTARGTGVPDGL